MRLVSRAEASWSPCRESDVVLWLPKQVLPESVGCFKSPTGEGYLCP